ncbi:MAG: ATP synthase subunit I [Acidimicrobiales bacterium]
MSVNLDVAVREAPAVEREVAFDMARRGMFAAPVLIAVTTAIWGVHGGISCAFAIVLAVGNLLLAAALLSWAARISFAAMAAVALGGYIVRLAMLTVVVLAVRHQTWVSWLPLALTLMVTHLGLLLWETKFISATLAFPGLKPRPQKGR